MSDEVGDPRGKAPLAAPWGMLALDTRQRYAQNGVSWQREFLLPRRLLIHVDCVPEGEHQNNLALFIRN